MGRIKVKHFLRGAALILSALVIAGCGGGGGDTGQKSSVTSSVLIKTSHLLPGSTVYGAMELTLNFPQGISVQLNPATGEPTTDVVKLVGATDAAMTFTTVKYTPATVSTNGTLKFHIYDTNGFSSIDGKEYVSVQLTALPGFKPKPTDFTLSGFSVSDLNGVVSNPDLPTMTIE